MPISSYVIFPVPGKYQEMLGELKLFPECELFPARNKEVAVLVSETGSDKETEILVDKLKSLPAVQCMSLAWAQIPEKVAGGPEC